MKEAAKGSFGTSGWMRRLYRKVRTAASGSYLPPDRIDDVVQDVALAVLRVDPGGLRRVRSCEPYLRVAVSHAVHRELGRVARERWRLIALGDGGQEGWGPAAPAQAMRGGEVDSILGRAPGYPSAASLEAAIRCLSAQDRLLLTEVYLKGTSQRRLAARLAVRENTLNQRVSRARRRLVARLRELGGPLT